MLVKLAEDVLVDASPDDVWTLLRDTPRLAGLLPGVESVTSLDEQQGEAYAARVSEKVGPFKITLKLEVRVTEIREPSLLRAAIKGADSVGLNHVTGSMQVAVSPALSTAPGTSGTRMHFEASVEVLGKLATLGAVPIRRRVSQSFAEFGRSVQSQFAKERP